MAFFCCGKNSEAEIPCGFPNASKSRRSKLVNNWNTRYVSVSHFVGPAVFLAFKLRSRMSLSKKHIRTDALTRT